MTGTSQVTIRPDPRVYLAICSCLLLACLLAACGSGTATAPGDLETITDAATPETEAAHVHYVCPMHPQIIRDEPGSCPICGMDLVAKHATPAAHDDTAHTHYVCPMHPQIVRDEPGSCPICGMALVAKDGHATAPGMRPQVALDAAVIQDMGVRTSRVARGTLQRHIQTQGTVTYDEDRIMHVHSRTPGWVETLNMRTDGETVKRKDELAQFFSPLVVQLQLEYIEALEAVDLAKLKSADLTEPNARVQSLRNSLKLLHMMDMDIMRLENYRTVQNTIPIIAPQGGVVTKLGVREGMYVEPDDTMFTIVDLSNLWVMVDIYEYQMSWVKPGLKATIRVPALRDRSWEGKVDFIYPEVDPIARTLRARISVTNPDRVLVPNMFAEVTLESAPNRNTLIVPREAVIPTGERETVIKALGNGHFQPVEVTSGMWVGADVEILSGLQEGEEIVVSGQFLIDSESSLQADFARMAE
ncbi:MAG: efflux RND transporter periplasmic adaptor subunit [Pseudomonadota bacterium]